MNLIPASLFCSSLIFLFFGILIVLKAQNKNISKVFNLFVFSFAFWSFGLAMYFSETELLGMIFWAKFLYFAATFIPPSFVLFSYVFPKSSISELKSTGVWLFVPNILFFYLLFYTPLIIKEVYLVNGVKAFVYGWGKLLWDLHFNSLLIFGFVRYIRMFRVSEGIYKEHLRYLIIGDMYIYIFAGTTNVLLPMFSIFKYIWAGPILSIFWVFLIFYIIFKYRLLDIKLVITRASIFVFVYSLVLGIPIWVGFKLLGNGQWLMPMILMAIFATLGPFIYLYIQQRAENRLLSEQKRYQATLRQASAGMGKIKDLKKLLNMIVFILTRAVRIEHAVVFMRNDEQKKYVLSAVKRRSGFYKIPKEFPTDSSFVQFMEKSSHPILLEDIKQRIQDNPNPQLSSVEDMLISLEGVLAFPIFIDKGLIAIVVMGKKESGKSYTEEDISVFTILSNQAALAIENAQFYEDMKLTQQQLFQAEKMATIGTMADGLSHQINNRFHALGFIAGDALDTIQMNKDNQQVEQLKLALLDLEKALIRIQENVVQGGEIVQGLLRYTRKGDAAFTAVDIDAVLKSAIEMTQFKIKVNELAIIKDYDPLLIPPIKGNFTQLQEVFFNMIDNAYDAMMQRKVERNEPGYQPTLIVHIKAIGSIAEIIFEDNGMGVKATDIQKLFTPFFTTKLSSKKGTGLGLYVIKKIVEENHGGKVEFSSVYLTGTRIKLSLPLASS